MNEPEDNAVDVNENRNNKANEIGIGHILVNFLN